jgi:hypothetical protein
MILGGVAAALAVAASTHAAFIVDYTQDLGGGSLDGLAARATFDIVGTELTVLLENTSTGAPVGFEVSDSLLVSVAFNLTGGVHIVNGESALIGPGSVGLGRWSDRAAGDAVNEEWAWTNDGAGDELEAFAQGLSTSNGFGSGTHTRFDGVQGGGVSGPFGGIAAAPPVIDVPGPQRAVSNSILFTLTLSGTLSDADLATIANTSIVEYGSDARYVMVPGPSVLALLLLAGLGARRRSRPAL